MGVVLSVFCGLSVWSWASTQPHRCPLVVGPRRLTPSFLILSLCCHLRVQRLLEALAVVAEIDFSLCAKDVRLDDAWTPPGVTLPARRVVETRATMTPEQRAAARAAEVGGSQCVPAYT